ncbi:MAG: arginine--tRNA ligase [Burkholderiales bacterium]|nr:arginine--tRNA ligase [Burkholderiales bacterium]
MTDPLHDHVTALLRQALAAVAPQAASTAIVLERPKQASHGDYASNIALQLARTLKQKPRAIAEALVAALPASAQVAAVEVAGAGFINFRLRSESKLQVVARALVEGERFGRAAGANGERVQVEFVSANPTGPLHVGHGRGAAYGASVANVLAAAGYAVTREYYVNDAGRQMDILALSAWLRYLELCAQALDFPGNAYQGEYVREMAQRLHQREGARLSRPARDIEAMSVRLLLDAPRHLDAEGEAVSDAEQTLDALIATAKTMLAADYDVLHRFALEEQLADCRQDLQEFGVVFDQWFSEQSLYIRGKVEQALALIEAAGHSYTRDGALWFRSSAFGDEKDRVLRRENGAYTYFASDIAYHLDKLARGFDRIIDVWGADHHGYVPRVKGALRACGADAQRLHVALVQFAVLYRGGEKVSMSTRSGQFVTLRELRNEVGNDAARFFYVLRKSDQHLDFDLDLAKSQSLDNPVYYLQYAHARISSVLALWGADAAALAQADLAPLADEHEIALASRLGEYPQVVAAAARDLSPHLIAFYLRELCAAFHSYYNAVPFLVDDQPTKLARLALIAAVRQALRNGLGLLGVSAPERM